MDGAITTDFLSMEELLDSKAGGEVEVEVERGGAPITARIKVRGAQHKYTGMWGVGQPSLCCYQGVLEECKVAPSILLCRHVQRCTESERVIPSFPQLSDGSL